MENLMLGLKVAAIGIIAVFVVLIILMLVINLFKFLIAKIAEVKKKADSAHAVATPVATAVAPVVVGEDESEIVAVISAAIMAILAGENNASVPNFEIKKIKLIKRN